jgi:hypothetical protein
MEHHSEVFVALDTAKLRNAVAIADAGRNGEIRYLGELSRDRLPDVTDAAAVERAGRDSRNEPVVYFIGKHPVRTASRS